MLPFEQSMNGIHDHRSQQAAWQSSLAYPQQQATTAPPAPARHVGGNQQQLPSQPPQASSQAPGNVQQAALALQPGDGAAVHGWQALPRALAGTSQQHGPAANQPATQPQHMGAGSMVSFLQGCKQEGAAGLLPALDAPGLPALPDQPAGPQQQRPPSVAQPIPSARRLVASVSRLVRSTLLKAAPSVLEVLHLEQQRHAEEQARLAQQHRAQQRQLRRQQRQLLLRQQQQEGELLLQQQRARQEQERQQRERDEQERRQRAREQQPPQPPAPAAPRQAAAAQPPRQQEGQRQQQEQPQGAPSGQQVAEPHLPLQPNQQQPQQAQQHKRRRPEQPARPSRPKAPRKPAPPKTAALERNWQQDKWAANVAHAEELLQKGQLSKWPRTLPEHATAHVAVLLLLHNVGWPNWQLWERWKEAHSSGEVAMLTHLKVLL